MQLHETPSEVAILLARHVPHNIRRIIDPAVGEGALLLPIASRLTGAATIVCVDINADALSKAKNQLESICHQHVECISGDFLVEFNCNRHLRNGTFDCVVMNPPYAAKRAEWVASDCVSLGWPHLLKTPKEIAFVLKGMELLRPSGRLLAILPASLIASTHFSRLRDAMAQRGRFHYVHELPRYTFPGVEGRVYLLVFEKGGVTKSIELRNHDLRSPEILRVSWNDSGRENRMDFGFHEGRNWTRSLIDATSKLQWRPLDELCAIQRGPRCSPHGPKIALHTTDFDGDFWRVAKRHRMASKSFQISQNDLFVSRVSRNCLLSLGSMGTDERISWTDCVIRLRSLDGSRKAELLFALRAIFGFDQCRILLERGVGATYVTCEDLSAFLVPSALALFKKSELNKYSAALESQNCSEMRRLEQRLRQWFLSHIDQPFVQTTTDSVTEMKN